MRRYGSSNEKSTAALSAANGTAGTLPWRTIDQLVAQPLRVPFAMVMRHEVGERPPKMAFTERDHAIEAFLSHRAHEPLRMRIVVRRQERCANHPDACCREKALDGGAPLPIDRRSASSRAECLQSPEVNNR
jgi:hypothetical protein